MVDRVFALWREECSAHFSQSKGSRSNVIGRAIACTNAHARIVRDSADGQGGIVVKPLAICANCSKSALKREKAFRVYATVRVCEKARENAFASTLRRPVTYAHIARTRTLRDPTVLLAQSDETWSKRVFSR